MARIAIYQVDGTDYEGVQFPNIALMKISAYHKSIGDTVEWYEGILFASQYDKIYASKIFKFSEVPQIPKNMVIGGTGIDSIINFLLKLKMLQWIGTFTPIPLFIMDFQ